MDLKNEQIVVVLSFFNDSPVANYDASPNTPTAPTTNDIFVRCLEKK